MAKTYRIEWETVGTNHLGKFSNADPMFYKNTTQTVPNSQIPDEFWHKSSRETDDPWDQYRTLKAWADADAHFVRKVKLLESSPAEWREVSVPNVS